MKSKNISELPAASLPTAIIIIVCASLCFLNSYDGDFVFDDSEAIVHNDDVKDTRISDVFKNDFWGMRLSHNQSHKSYRPLTILTFRLQYWLRNGILLSSDFHIINILLHTIVCILNLFLFDILLDSKCQKVVFYAAILFAVHPVHTEAIAGIVGRADVLCTLFMWLSILFYNRHIYSKSVFLRWISICASLICTTTAILCKETGITVIGICAVYDLIIVNKIQPLSLFKLITFKYSYARVKHFMISKQSGLIMRFFILAVSAIVLLLLRFSIMDFTTPNFQFVDNPASHQSNYIIRVLSYNYIHSLNLWLLLCPEWLCFDWSMGCVPLINNLNIRIFAILLYWTFLASLIVFTFSKKSNQYVRNVIMGLTVLIIPFLPASNFFFKVGFVLAERTLYIPSAGYCLLVATGLEVLSKRFKSTKVLFSLYIALVTIFFMRSWMRSNEWRTETSLFKSGNNVCPLNAKVHYNIAKNAADIGNLTYAELEYEEALRLHPEYAQAMNNLGNLLKNQQKYEQAEKLFRKAIKLKEDFAAAWMNLGITLSALKKYKDSENSYLKALTYRSKYPDCYYNLGVLYLEEKYYQKALKSWETAIQQKTTHRKAWINMILLLNDLGKFEKALQMGKSALIFLPNDAAIHFNIGNMLGKIGKFEEAEKYFETALYYEPYNYLYYTNLGVLYHRWNRLQDAEKMYKEALRINPNSHSTHENLDKLKSIKLSSAKQ